MGKKIIKDDRLVEDFWLLDLAAEGADTAGESAAKNRVVSLEQWQQNRELLLASIGPRGVAISNDDDVLELADDVAHLDLICVQFPAAGDGRGYSQAKLLRDRLGFKNEIRAIGEVLTDQLFLMRRSGINAFDLQADQDPEASLARLRPFSVSYQ